MDFQCKSSGLHDFLPTITVASSYSIMIIGGSIHWIGRKGGDEYNLSLTSDRFGVEHTPGSGQNHRLPIDSKCPRGDMNEQATPLSDIKLAGKGDRLATVLLCPQSHDVCLCVFVSNQNDTRSPVLRLLWPRSISVIQCVQKQNKTNTQADRRRTPSNPSLEAFSWSSSDQSCCLGMHASSIQPNYRSTQQSCILHHLRFDISIKFKTYPVLFLGQNNNQAHPVRDR